MKKKFPDELIQFVGRGLASIDATNRLREAQKETTMPKKPSPDPAQLVWYNSVMSCPRCASPIRARATASFSRLLEAACSKCPWKFDIEALRISLRDANRAPEAEDVPQDGT